MLKNAPKFVLFALLALPLLACSSSFLQTKDFKQPYHFAIDENAKIERNDENIEVLLFVQKYRNAIANKDIETLKTMISSDYYENASTTDDLTDDYGNEKLDELFHDYLLQSVRDIRFVIEIKQLIKEGMQYFVNYQYIWNFRYEVAGQSYWQSNNDTNRMTIVYEDDALKIQGGL